MPKNVTIELRSEFREEPGDGTVCATCGDPAWLKQFRAWLIHGAESIRTNVILCASCLDAHGIQPSEPLPNSPTPKLIN